MIEYRPPFLNRLELDAFFQKYRIALEVQGAQHRLHSTSWYKDVKKLEDIVNRKKDAFVWNLDNGIFLIEVRYDQNPEIVIPERIRKIKEFVNQASKKYLSQLVRIEAPSLPPKIAQEREEAKKKRRLEHELRPSIQENLVRGGDMMHHTSWG
ncbi:14249_t:CDS:2, partial [Rhizophagus irregularis]